MIFDKQYVQICQLLLKSYIYFQTFSQFPAFGNLVTVHMVEVSPKMSQLQEAKLTVNPYVEEITDIEITKQPYKTVESKYGPVVHWYKDLRQVPRGFSCYIAHEFFDALPIYKFHVRIKYACVCRNY